MKKMKKLFAILFMLVLIAVLMITAYAADDSSVTEDEDGNLTVNGETITPYTSDTFSSYYDVTDNEEGYTFTHIFIVSDGVVTYVEEAFPDSVITEEGISGGALTIYADYVNGISVESGDYRIEDITITQIGDGVCDFQAFGTAIGIVGGDVIVDNVTVYTEGDIITALNAGGDANVVVMNSDFTALGTAEDSTGLHSGKVNFSGYQGAITEVPWVLGLYGTLRATNLIGDADIVYYNTSVEANGWGVYSTDGGATHTLINCYGYISDDSTFGSGYGTYALGLTVNYLGIIIDVPTYGIVARCGFTMMESTQENIALVENDAMSLFMEELGGDYSSIEAQRNTITAEYGVMSHGASDGTFDISGTDFYVDEAVFLLKDAYMDIEVTDTTITFNDLEDGEYGTILHAMLTDDAGIDMFGYDSCWAICSTFIYDELTDPEAIEVTNEVNATFTDEELAGNFYNTMTNGGALNLVFDGTTVDGTITSGTYVHNNASYYIVDDGEGGYIAVDADGNAYTTLSETGMMGTTYYYPETDDDGSFVYSGESYDTSLIIGYCIYYTDADYLNDVTITAAAAINNPVYVELTNGSVWDVADTCYISGYTVDETSQINGEITEISDGVYMVTPADEDTTPVTDSSSPQTGDSFVWLVIALVCTAGIVVLAGKKYKAQS